jgi:DNA processing protein
MSFSIEELPKDKFPRALLEIPQPPKQLNYRGNLPPSDMKLLAVVGSRKYTSYGKQVVDYLIQGLRGHNIGIVSGLALGIDSLAHQAALDNGIYTLAIPGGGLDDKVIYPRQHLRLAYQILEAGGGMLSEFEPDFHVTKWSFTQRNRLVCGIAEATLIIEASEKSGTLITARLTADYNRELLVVPGNIFSDNSKGVHQFLKLGATPVTTPEDILEVLGIKVSDGVTSSSPSALSPEENRIIEILFEPTERDSLIRQLSLPISAASIILMQMEIAGHIVEENGVYRKAH